VNTHIRSVQTAMIVSFLFLSGVTFEATAALATQTANGQKRKAPHITAQPVNQTVTAGQSTSFSVSAMGGISYQWQKNGAVINGATNSSYSTPATTISDSGSQFTVTVSNNVGSVTSNPALLTVNAAMSAPVITSQPTSQTVTVPNSAVFSAAATGTAPMSYQWMRNGLSISGASGSTYMTSATSTSDNGAAFSVVISNAVGSATSAAAILTVAPATTILLNPNVSNLNFGNVNLSSSGSQNVTLTNAGNSNVTISQVMVSGAGFNAGGAAGLILSPGQSTAVNVTFTPSTSGAASGSVIVSSNATNSPATIGLTGTGVTPIVHSVSLSWTDGDIGVTGYNTYVASVSGGPYLKLTSTPTAVTSYVDSTVQSGRTYYYVVTALDATNQESTYSSEIAAIVP
jgi:Abnormal spindle-like microcephaly-assoc'd, ASPM-SPD-2-Hydin/Immunoglobulin domain